MSKELEALQKIASFEVNQIYDIKFDNGDREHYECETIIELFPNDFAEIETELKRLEELEDRINELEETNHLMFLREHENTKKLKALEIIKKKEVDIGWLKRAKDLREYNSGMGINSYSALTQEEYDLLKEVLL